MVHQRDLRVLLGQDVGGMMKRVAVAYGTSVETVSAYLPSNYTAYEGVKPMSVLIIGEDYRGWTLEDYVIPRLSSGLIGAKILH